MLFSRELLTLIVCFVVFTFSNHWASLSRRLAPLFLFFPMISPNLSSSIFHSHIISDPQFPFGFSIQALSPSQEFQVVDFTHWNMVLSGQKKEKMGFARSHSILLERCYIAALHAPYCLSAFRHARTPAGPSTGTTEGRRILGLASTMTRS